jgi:hypothetical protein
MTKPTSHTTYDFFAKVLQAYREWAECTGVVSEGTGYFYEIESLLEDAYNAGLEDASRLVEESQNHCDCYVGGQDPCESCHTVAHLSCRIRALKDPNPQPAKTTEEDQ